MASVCATIVCKCAGCSTEIPDRRFLTCSICTDKYDLICANVSQKRFYNTMTAEHKATWICPQCKSKKPKANNITIPVRQLFSVPSVPENNTEAVCAVNRSQEYFSPIINITQGK